MKSSRAFQTKEDNLEGERGDAVPGMFIERSARRRRRRRGRVAEDQDWGERIKRRGGRDEDGENVEEERWRENCISKGWMEGWG